jgi:hypothetical protein
MPRDFVESLACAKPSASLDSALWVQKRTTSAQGGFVIRRQAAGFPSVENPA